MAITIGAVPIKAGNTATIVASDGQGAALQGGGPVGPTVTTKTVQSDSTIGSIAGLTAGDQYALVGQDDAGTWHWVHFTGA